MQSKLLLLITVIIISIISCSKKEEPQKVNTQPSIEKWEHEVVVQEVINVNQYTYLRVKEGGKENWLAVTRADFKEGEVLLYNKAMEMKNFESKELKRKFESILFVDDVSQKLGVGSLTSPQKPTLEKENISVSPAAGGVTIAQIFSNTNSFADKTVKVKGKVVKVNTGIMKTNWVHVQDGTSSGNDFDLTVTTNDIVNVGDIVTLEGKIVLNKDFGYGYSYKVLLENARVYKNL